MQTLKPIGLETQILDTLFGMPEQQAKEISEKIEFLKANIDRIKAVNGKEIFHPFIDDKNINYELSENKRFGELAKYYNGDTGYRTYYYPIQYAEVELTPLSE